MDFDLYGPDGRLVQAKASSEGGMLVTPTFSADIELTRRGGGLSVITTTTVAGLVDRPTTAALATLVNNEPGGGKSYIIDALMAFMLVSGTAAEFGTIWACVHPVGRADAVTNNITARGNMTGRPVVNPGNSIFGINDSVTNDGWFPWGESSSMTNSATGVLPGGGRRIPVGGKIILPPTAALSLHVVGSSGDGDYTVGVAWDEVQMAVNTG